MNRCTGSHGTGDGPGEESKRGWYQVSSDEGQFPIHKQRGRFRVPEAGRGHPRFLSCSMLSSSSEVSRRAEEWRLNELQRTSDLECLVCLPQLSGMGRRPKGPPWWSQWLIASYQPSRRRRRANNNPGSLPWPHGISLTPRALLLRRFRVPQPSGLPST